MHILVGFGVGKARIVAAVLGPALQLGQRVASMADDGLAGSVVSLLVELPRAVGLLQPRQVLLRRAQTVRPQRIARGAHCS
jgi:hypothetical protein